MGGAAVHPRIRRRFRSPAARGTYTVRTTRGWKAVTRTVAVGCGALPAARVITEEGRRTWRTSPPVPPAPHPPGGEAAGAAPRKLPGAADAATRPTPGAVVRGEDPGAPIALRSDFNPLASSPRERTDAEGGSR